MASTTDTAESLLQQLQLLLVSCGSEHLYMGSKTICSERVQPLSSR